MSESCDAPDEHVRDINCAEIIRTSIWISLIQHTGCSPFTKSRASRTADLTVYGIQMDDNGACHNFSPSIMWKRLRRIGLHSLNPLESHSLFFITPVRIRNSTKTVLLNTSSYIFGPIHYFYRYQPFRQFIQMPIRFDAESLYEQYSPIFMGLLRPFVTLFANVEDKFLRLCCLGKELYSSRRELYVVCNIV